MDQKKYRLAKKPLEQLPVPAVLWVPLPGAQASSGRCVKPGERVLQYSQLSMPQNSVVMCAPASGTVTQVQVVTHPLTGDTACAVLETDHMKKELRPQPPDVELTPDALVSIAQMAGIIDEYDGVPLYKKLKRFRRLKIDWLGANALDDEPYVCSGLAMLRQDLEAVLQGLTLAAKACGAAERKIAVTSKARAKRWSGIAHDYESMLTAAGEIYPAWPNLLRRLQLQKKHPGLIGVQACAALYAAVKKGQPQTTTIITLSGEGFSQWKNIRVPLGALLSDVTQSGEPQEGATFTIGSPFTGGKVDDLNMPVTADTRCVLAIPAKAQEVRRFPCIGCVRCARACPKGLMPWYIYERMQQEKKRIDPASLLHADRCCGCRACSVVCPSGLPLAETVQRAAELQERGGLT